MRPHPALMTWTHADPDGVLAAMVLYIYIPARMPDIPGARQLSAARAGASQPPGVHDAPQEPPRALVLGIGEQLGRRGILDDPPFLEEAHPAGDVPGEA